MIEGVSILGDSIFTVTPEMEQCKLNEKNKYGAKFG